MPLTDDELFDLYYMSIITWHNQKCPRKCKINNDLELISNTEIRLGIKTWPCKIIKCPTNEELKSLNLDDVLEVKEIEINMNKLIFFRETNPFAFDLIKKIISKIEQKPNISDEEIILFANEK